MPDTICGPCGVCTTCVPRDEHRGSRMPDLLRECASDPLFADAAFRPFTPAERVMVAEKVELPHLLRMKGAL